MSHIVSIKTEVRDPVAIRSACRRLGLLEPLHGTAQLFSDQATGLLLRLPGWLYPAVLDTATGQVTRDRRRAWPPACPRRSAWARGTRRPKATES